MAQGIRLPVLDTRPSLIDDPGHRRRCQVGGRGTFQIGKGQVGLDHYQCRTWTAWHRYTVLAMAALAVLVAITTAEPAPPTGLAALSVPEARRLLTSLTSTTIDPDAAIGWSLWRRRHIAGAQASHHKHRMIIESEHANQ